MNAVKGFRRLLRFAARWGVGIQGAYYLASGLWPLVAIASFQAVTGPKTDIWLVKTIGLLLVVIGLALLLAASRRRVALQTTVLGGGTALALIGIELVYVFNGTIAAVYLLDTVLEIGFLAGWLYRSVSGAAEAPSATST